MLAMHVSIFLIFFNLLKLQQSVIKCNQYFKYSTTPGADYQMFRYIRKGKIPKVYCNVFSTVCDSMKYIDIYIFCG